MSGSRAAEGAKPGPAQAGPARISAKSGPLQYTLIDQPSQLPLLLAALDRVDEIALDTEADNLYHFKTRVCLLQILAGKDIYLLDVLAPLKLDAFWKKLARKHLVMHGSDFDLRLLYDLCGFTVHSLFDTMLAAQLLNTPRIGLASLLEQHFGVALSKDSQKANWSRRPINREMLDYAALDVFHLPALRDLLTRELSRLHRLDWLEQQCRRQIEAGLSGFPSADENDWRIGQSEKLHPHGQAMLHAVWHWRQTTAEKLDVPPFKVTGTDLLLRLAQAADAGATTVDAVLAGIHLGKRHPRLIASLTAAVQAGLAKDPATLPRRRSRNPGFTSLTHAEVALQDRIKADRDRAAAKLALDPTLIASRGQLAQLARDPGRLDEILLPWQAGLLRDAPALAACQT